MNPLRRAAIAALLLLAASGTARTGDAAGLEFSESWVRALPPGMGMTAGFGLLQNRGAAPIELVAFSSPDFGDVSLHRTEQVEGMSRMREVEALTIPAGGAQELAPGGFHLMLMKPTTSLQPGTAITIRMKAADGRAFSFTVPVEAR